MIVRIPSSIGFVVVVAACLPVATLSFVTQPSRFSDGSSVLYAPSQKVSRRSSILANPKPSLSFARGVKQQQAFCTILSAKKKKKSDSSNDEGNEDGDFDWEPNDDDLSADLGDLEGLDEVFNLDDVESSVTGTGDDVDEDDIEYEDEEEEFEEEDDGIEEEDDEIDEEDDELEDDDDDDDDGDFDIANVDELNNLLESGGMTEKPPDGYSKWWEDYGFSSRDDFENHEPFPGGMAGLAAGRYQEPENDFWDDEVTMVPLAKDSKDSTYNENLKLVLESSKRRQSIASDITKTLKEESSSKTLLDGEEEPVNELDSIAEAMDLLDAAVPGEQGSEETPSVGLSDFRDADQIRSKMMETTNLIDDEPYPENNRTNIAGTSVSDEDMMALDRSWKKINKVTEEEPWNKVAAKQFNFDYDAYPKQYHYDMQETAVEIGSASYNIYPWLKYDFDFNVTNLILASIQHNPDAPVILQHWYPQLMVCERYQHARDRDFDFTWDDVQAANMTELKTYYLGFGYEEIPKKAPSETGLISMEEADEQEIKMAAMEKWMLDVYNSEWDRKDFDDEDLKSEDNVFADNFAMPQHPDLPSWEDAQEDIQGWKEEFEESGSDEDEESIQYRDSMGQSIDFTPNQDDDFQKNFRGHLVVACGNFEPDLDAAEKITTRMEEEFGNAIYTETKIYKHAMEADNVFEVWLESYEIDLLHSKRRAFMGVEGWDGNPDVDEPRMDYLVEEISRLTSDDARNSYRWVDEHIS